MTARRAFDLSLYLIVGPGDVAGRRIVDVVMEAVAGGVTAVQLRRKDNAVRAFVEEARALRDVLRLKNVPLVVNDRVDVALAAQADGVHLGHSDMLPADARRLLGAEALIGLSVSTVAEARLLDTSVADYAGIGPVFDTATKADAGSPLGIAATRDICSMLRVPSVAIGGITLANAVRVLATGVHGVAIVSAICSAADPREASLQLAALTRGAR